jgi:hypothetical protein
MVKCKWCKKDYPEELKAIIENISKDYNNILKQFSESSLRKVKQPSNYLIAISQDPYDIARMSTGRDWTSCMQLGVGTYHKDVFCEIEAGGLIAYLIKKDDKDIEEPVARISIKRFTNQKGKSFALPEKTTYGNASKAFYETVLAWIESKQGKMQKGEYKREGGGYSDTFGRSRTMNVARNIARQMIKLAQLETKNWYKNVKLANF